MGCPPIPPLSHLAIIMKKDHCNTACRNSTFLPPPTILFYTFFSALSHLPSTLPAVPPTLYPTCPSFTHLSLSYTCQSVSLQHIILTSACCSAPVYPNPCHPTFLSWLSYPNCNVPHSFHRMTISSPKKKIQ